jgi:hypothetical protein
MELVERGAIGYSPIAGGLSVLDTTASTAQVSDIALIAPHSVFDIVLVGGLRQKPDQFIHWLIVNVSDGAIEKVAGMNRTIWRDDNLLCVSASLCAASDYWTAMALNCFEKLVNDRPHVVDFQRVANIAAASMARNAVAEAPFHGPSFPLFGERDETVTHSFEILLHHDHADPHRYPSIKESIHGLLRSVEGPLSSNGVVCLCVWPIYADLNLVDTLSNDF